MGSVHEVSRCRNVAMLIGALLLNACVAATPQAPTVPSEEEALSYLQSVVAVVEAGDLSRLCDLGSGTCLHTLRNSDQRPCRRQDRP